MGDGAHHGARIASKPHLQGDLEIMCGSEARHSTEFIFRTTALQGS